MLKNGDKRTIIWTQTNHILSVRRLPALYSTSSSASWGPFLSLRRFFLDILASSDAFLSELLCLEASRPRRGSAVYTRTGRPIFFSTHSNPFAPPLNQVVDKATAVSTTSADAKPIFGLICQIRPLKHSFLFCVAPFRHPSSSIKSARRS